ncbi:MAG: peptide chain release factor 1 [Clostridia bacterium]|nr:peptide chain release factor 1 [Clostridia bacterium]
MLEATPRLEELLRRYEELSTLLSDPALMADQQRWLAHVKEHAQLEPLAAAYRRYRACQGDLAAARSMLEESSDPKTREWLREEARRLEEELAAAEAEVRRLLLPRDPRDEKNVILEIRAGAGGDEAALFAADLLRMYTRYAERCGWRTELLHLQETEIGGVREAFLAVAGRGAYSRLKYESGTHRVQRVPETESAGRIHTSTATVAVLPEAEEVDVEIRPEDLQIDTFRAGGAGGQHVNKTESAIRITHLPTGLVVTCQDERSQHKNKARALQILRAKLYEMAVAERQNEVSSVRRAQVGTAERSERIRTYNFPQGRVTDHRIGLTLYKLPLVLDGDLDELIDALVAHFEAERLASAR